MSMFDAMHAAQTHDLLAQQRRTAALWQRYATTRSHTDYLEATEADADLGIAEHQAREARALVVETPGYDDYDQFTAWSDQLDADLMAMAVEGVTDDQVDAEIERTAALV